MQAMQLDRPRSPLVLRDVPVPEPGAGEPAADEAPAATAAAPKKKGKKK